MGTLHTITSCFLAVEFTLMAGAFAFGLRKRHARTLWPVFWFVAAFLLLRGMTFAFFVCSQWTRTTWLFNAAVMSATLSALMGLVAVVFLYWHLPSILKIPPSREVYETQLKLKQMFLEVVNRLAELPEDMSIEQKLKKTQDVLKTLTKGI